MTGRVEHRDKLLRHGRILLTAVRPQVARFSGQLVIGLCMVMLDSLKSTLTGAMRMEALNYSLAWREIGFGDESVMNLVDCSAAATKDTKYTAWFYRYAVEIMEMSSLIGFLGKKIKHLLMIACFSLTRKRFDI